MTDRDTDPLERFFDAARTGKTDLPAHFLQRIEAQALAEIPMPATPAPRWSDRLRGIWSDLGGWPAAAGLGAAVAAGLAVAFYLPQDMGAWLLPLGGADAALNLDALAPVDGFEYLVAEG